MEIRQVLRGQNTRFSPARQTEREKAGTASARPSADRVELSRQWAEAMEEQRAQPQAALLTGGREEKKSGGILDMLDQPSAEEEELDALSKQLDVQQKCLKIAMNIMRGKKVPPEDERFLMENDPEGYKLAIAMRSMAKEDDEECESVLKDEDKEGEETSRAEESAPTESAPAEPAPEAE